jgi:1,2-diacylglycerol 3-beta-galactosyltransferase
VEGRTRRLLILFCDTGGGHRSAARAVAEALQELHGAAAQIELLDALRGGLPPPLSQLGSAYPTMVRLGGWPWAAGYHLLDGRRRVAPVKEGWWSLARAAVLRLLREHPADAILCCHPVFNDPLLRALTQTGARARTSLIALVTDLIAAHAFWFAPGVTCCLVPTAGARQRALACGIPAERVQVTGLPVSARFVAAAREDRLVVRQRLRLEPGLPVVLLVSGAEGMGPLHRLCRTLADSGVRAQLVAIAGRNERLRARLAAEPWSLPVRVEGFVDNMHEWMRAADLLVSKAGPSTISEALVVGLPIVLSGALPGQERPNVDHVVQAGAGVWAPTPRGVAAAVGELLAPDNPRLAHMAARAQALAQPGAARRVAQVVWDFASAGASAKLA